MKKQLYIPQTGWECVESCVSIIRCVLGYKTQYPHKKFVNGTTPTGIKHSFVAMNAHRFFPEHEVAMWYNAHYLFGSSLPKKLPKTYRGPIPATTDVIGNYIFMFDYGTWGSFHVGEGGQMAVTTHTVVGYPAFADGMWYHYIMRVSVTPKLGEMPS